ncbi:MAG: murein biosynthesis integral membrane protein MurJ [Hyphomicrobiaceae bacterium]|nr:murein biosynthesis integral membrane protein MurJ [Hyphomicrobiaceae bacterium]
MGLYRNFFSVGAMTMLSRVLGFVRDMLMANVLGTGLAADAFFAAFRFPNLFRRLFAEGAFNSAFVPLFSGALEQKGEKAAEHLANHIMSWLMALLLVVTVLAEIFMPAVMYPFVPGFADDPEKFDLTVLLARICFPYLAFMSLMSAYGAMLNSFGRFIEAAFAPVLLNVVLVILIGVLVLLAHDDQVLGAVYISWGTLAGGAAQFALVYWAVQSLPVKPKLSWPHFGTDVRRFWVLALPAILTGGITQVNIFIGTIIASGAASAISYLYYADRLYQLPLGIIGIAVGVVLLPELSRHLKADRTDAARKSLDDSLLFAMLLSVPAAVALMAISEPIIRVLFERGNFSAEATRQTAAALVAFAAGLPAFVAIKVFQPPYFAREDTMTPTIFAAISVVINVGLSLLLFPSLEHVGIAIATSASAWANTLLLVGFLVRRGHYRLTLQQASIYGRVLGAAVGMGLVLVGFGSAFEQMFASAGGFWREFGFLAVAVLLGLVVYALLIHVTRVIRLNQVRARFLR